MTQPFLNKQILITGASSGLGAACAERLLAGGANVVLAGRNEPQISSDLSAAVKFLSFDLANPESYSQLAAEIKRGVGALDGCVLAAGANALRPLALEGAATMEALWKVNVLGSIGVAAALLKSRMIKPGASIVLFSSAAVGGGASGMVSYSSTKGAIEAATRSLAAELSRDRIRVNAVAPGVVRTPMTERHFAKLSTDQVKAVEARHPLGLGEPNDVAAAVEFLLSDNARWITGTVLNVDGGFSIS